MTRTSIDLPHEPHPPQELVNAAQLEDAGRIAEAAAIYFDFCQRGDPIAAFNYARLLLGDGRGLPDATAIFEQLLERYPGSRDVRTALAFCCVESADVARATQLFAECGLESEALWYSLHLNTPGSEIRHAQWGERQPPRTLSLAAWDGKRPLRVGYVGTSALALDPVERDKIKASRVEGIGRGVIGNVSRFLNPILANHDPAAVQVKLYAKPTLQEIRADQLDVAVDLNGHLAGGVNQHLFAAGCATIECSYIGYPHATGLPHVWRISDHMADPIVSYEHERVLHLHGCCWAYQPREDPPRALPPFEGNGYVTFGCLNRACKINRQVATTWAEVLRMVPDSRLLVLAMGGEHNLRVRGLLEECGVPATRLRLEAPSPRHERFLELCAKVDISLDPFPYAGMTTTCDGLWQGVPVVTLAGYSHRARVGASILTAVGLSDWIAEDLAHYVELAVIAAFRLDVLAELRDELRGMVARSPLCDGRRVAAALEEAWRRQLTTGK